METFNRYYFSFPIMVTILFVNVSCVNEKVLHNNENRKKIKLEVDLNTAYYLFKMDKGGCLGLRSSMLIDSYLMGMPKDSILEFLGKPDNISKDQSQYEYYLGGDYCKRYKRPLKKYKDFPYSTLLLEFRSDTVSSVIYGLAN